MNGVHALTGVALALVGQFPGPAPAQLLHITTEFNLMVHAPYRQCAPLFEPEGERVWAGDDWDPKFIYPRPEADVEGAVFTINHGEKKAVWLTSRRDMEARHFQYVYFLPDVMVTLIDVRFDPREDDATRVHVTYSRTALTIDGNEDVKRFHAIDEAASADWQKAIDKYLETKRTSKNR